MNVTVKNDSLGYYSADQTRHTGNSLRPGIAYASTSLCVRLQAD